MTVAARLSRLALLALVALPLGAAPASAGDTCVDVEFTPTDSLQIAAWVEDAAGNYKATVYITQQIGSFGLGNRPGRFDFNSGPLWPYGRRITALPVWAYRQGTLFPTVIFQSSEATGHDDPSTCFLGSGVDYETCPENNLSHAFDQSSRETHFCRPMQPGEPGWDAMTCATTAFTDKGTFSMSTTSPYPPRADLVGGTGDSPSVAMYKAMNPFDAISQATPPGGAPANVTFPVPADWPAGDYVMFIETSKENDNNTNYNSASYPAPAGLAWGEYGVPYRGQPSIVYKVPFTIGASETTATATDYVGYGDPNGADGTIRAPDATITTDTPGSGASRLQLVSDSGSMYRVRIDVQPNVDAQPPGAPAALQSTTVGGSSAQFSFVAPGVDSGAVAGYEVRIRAVTEMTADNFEASMPVTTTITPVTPGQLQTFELDALLPETDYWVGIRAYDGCHNMGDLTILKFTTTVPLAGEVDACFVATAAYGSMMANDVELLRHFRDSLLQSTVLGELAVEGYYTFGPAVAGVVGQSELLRTTARDALAPIVDRVRKLSF